MNNKGLFGNMNVDESVLKKFRELQRIQINPQLLEQARIVSSQMEAFRSSINSNIQLQNHIAQISRSIEIFQTIPLKTIQRDLMEMYRPLLEIKPLIPQINLMVRAIFESIKPLRIKLSENNQLFEQLRQATSFSFAETVAQVAKDYATLLSRNQNFLFQMRESLISYNYFTQNTIKELAKISDVKINLALRASLILANEQTLRSADLIEPLLEKMRKGGRTSLLERIPSNRFQIQKRELLQRNDIEEDEEYESLVIKSPSAISFDLIVNCLKIVGLCNETSQTTKGSSIFTLTNSVWAYSFELLQTVPTNKEKFAEIIDYLYFILIEGAGGKFLRFVNYEDGKHFGYFANTEPEVEVIWKIKHLRNKWLRHDIEHGNESDIKKSYQLRREALEWFGMQKVPQSKDEFVFLYNNLMIKVEEFLKSLLNRVSKFTN